MIIIQRNNKVLKLLISLLLLVFLVSFAAPTAFAVKPASSHYNSCSKKYSEFVDIASCGKSARNRTCKSRCSAEGDSLVRYADTLAHGVKTRQITDYEAKIKFAEYQQVWDRNISNLNAAQRRQGQALMDLGAQISGGGSYYNNSGSKSLTCFYEREYTKGHNKVCQYSCVGSAHAFTVGATQICPPTVKK